MCDTLVIARPGAPQLFAKNSDRDPNEAQLLEWHPRLDHARGARLRCTWIEISQVERTNAVVLSRPFWTWGAEMGTNEHGLTIGNEAVFTRQPTRRTGLTGLDLVRLALERCESAREGAEAIVELIGRYGQGGGCGHEDRSFTYHNSFLLADGVEAFVLETADRLWAVERVEGTRSISNGLTIDGFAQRQGSTLKSWAARAAWRRRRVEALGREVTTPIDLMALLRDHGVGRDAPRYRSVFGALEAPCAHAGGLLVATQTTASWIAELGPDRQRLWATGTAAPCTSLFKPIAVDSPLDVGEPIDRADGSSLWWRHERLHRRMVRNPSAFGDILAERDAIERAWVSSTRSSAATFEVASRRLDDWVALAKRRKVTDIRPLPVKAYWAKHNRRAGLGLRGLR